MKKKQKRRLANIGMVIAILALLAASIVFAGKLRGWF